MQTLSSLCISPPPCADQGTWPEAAELIPGPREQMPPPWHPHPERCRGFPVSAAGTTDQALAWRVSLPAPAASPPPHKDTRVSPQGQKSPGQRCASPGQCQSAEMPGPLGAATPPTNILSASAGLWGCPMPTERQSLDGCRQVGQGRGQVTPLSSHVGAELPSASQTPTRQVALTPSLALPAFSRSSAACCARICSRQ